MNQYVLMPSIAQNHFPRFVWQNGDKLLWNPVQKKGYKNRPEERVRLRIVEAMIEAGWSKNRISVEEAIGPGRSGAGKSGGRTDIICYDRDFKPKILVECKAESVPLSPRVAEQTARYNRSVDAPYLLMSNGLEDLWYRVRPADQQRIERLNGVPDLLDMPPSRPRKEFSYWEERCFAGRKTAPGRREWLEELLYAFWFEEGGAIRFLEFGNAPEGLHLAHYYKIVDLDEGRIAVGFTNSPEGKTRLIGAFNREQQNIGMLTVCLDDLHDGRQPDTVIYSDRGTREVTIPDDVAEALSGPARKTAAGLPALLDAAFQKLA